MPNSIERLTSLRPQRRLQGQCGCNSVVECQLPKLDVEGSNPFTRYFSAQRAGTRCDRDHLATDEPPRAYRGRCRLRGVRPAGARRILDRTNAVGQLGLSARNRRVRHIERDLALSLTLEVSWRRLHDGCALAVTALTPCDKHIEHNEIWSGLAMDERRASAPNKQRM